MYLCTVFMAHFYTEWKKQNHRPCLNIWKLVYIFRKIAFKIEAFIFGSCWEAWCLYDWMSVFNFSCLNTYLAFIKCYIGWRITSVQMWNTKVHKMNTYVEHVTSIQIQVPQCSEFWTQRYWIWTHMLNMSSVFRCSTSVINMLNTDVQNI